MQFFLEFICMINKGNFTAIMVIIFIFIRFGDSFLPKPLSTYSLQTRNTINQLVIGLFPIWKPKVNPYQKTEKQLDDIQNNRANQK